MIFISVDRQVIADNLAAKLHDADVPDLALRGPIVVEIKGSSDAIYCQKVFIPVPCWVVYKPGEHDPDDPTSSVWIEVEGDVEAH